MSNTPDWTASMSPQPHQHNSYAPIQSMPPVTNESGVTVRSMRLKILYTFDEQSKVNCLARWPHILQLKTVVLDDTTTIGVVDLKTCVQAIAQCSPELIGNIGNDYAVYAFDYSEYDQPLVGQGMLSWALAAPSPKSNAPESDMDKFVTGRVCKNIQGLFSNGVRETLEVKFRLIPISTWSQHNFLSDIDHTSINSQPSQPVPKSTQYNSMAPGSSFEVMNQLLSPNPSQHNSDPFNNPVGNQETMGSCDPPATAVMTTGKISRPSSRTSVKRSRKPRVKEAVGGDTSGYEEGTDNDDAIPSKKRAKVVQADWNGKSTFGSSTESLRVAASTTNSIRSFRPVLSNSSFPPANHLQDTPRAPTPVPSLSRKPVQRAGSQQTSRRNSTLSQAPLRVLSPFPVHPHALRDQDIQASIEAAMSSPEKADSAAGTPPDIASSPPVMRDLSTRLSTPREAQSSPELPAMIRTESEFMNRDSPETLVLPEAVKEPVVEPTLPKLKQQSRRRGRQTDHAGFSFEEVIPGPPELLPTKMFTIDPKRQEVQALRAHRRADSIASDDGAMFAPPRDGERRPATPALPTKARPRQLLPAAPRPLLAPAPAPAPYQNLAPLPARTPLATTQLSTVHSMPPAIPSTTHQQQEGLQMPISTPVAPETTAPMSSIQPPQPMVISPSAVSSNVEDTTHSTAVPQQPQQDHSSRVLTRTASASALTLPAPIARSELSTQPTNLSRSQTWSEGPNASCEPESESVKVKTAIAKKTSIRLRLETAMAEGKIPPYCHNCGAIDTPTWRKCMIKTMQGEPGYHEYSDAPGKVIAISVLTKDEHGKPTSFQLYKKTLGPEEDKSEFEEILLCNPCGIWLSKFKSHRPQDKWFKEIKPRKKTAVPRTRRGKKGRRDSEAPATSEAWMQSDAATPGDTNDGAADWADSQAVAVMTSEARRSQFEGRGDADRQRAESVRPARIDKFDMVSDGAIGELRRAIQSSPGGRGSTHQSPIEIEDEDMGTTKRLLFPSPRREGVMKVLGHSANNSVQPVTHFSPGRAPGIVIVATTPRNTLDVRKVRSSDQESTMILSNRHTTPPPKASSGVFKTPTRPTPSHRPVTRSVSKSDRERQDTLPHMTPTKTPMSLRRSPRHARGVTESPFTASLNKLMSEVNNGTSPARHFGMNLESPLPELDPSALQNSFLEMHHFDHNQDFFSTDALMPSSPPRFEMFNDTMDMSDMHMDHSDIWNDFGTADGENHGEEQAGQFLIENGHDSFDTREQVIKAEPGEEECHIGG